MKKTLSSILAIAVAGATFGAIAQPAKKSTETTIEQSTTVQVPKTDVKVDEKKTTTTTTNKPAANAESKSKTTTTTTERKADGDKAEVKSTTTETQKKY